MRIDLLAGLLRHRRAVVVGAGRLEHTSTLTLRRLSRRMITPAWFSSATKPLGTEQRRDVLPPNPALPPSLVSCSCVTDPLRLLWRVAARRPR